MNVKKRILTALLVIFVLNPIMAQRIDWIGRANLSVGLDYQTQDFDGEDTFYSPGGGFGLEVGGQYELIEDLALYLTTGYQLHVGLRSEDFDDGSLTTSFGFNRKFFTTGFNKFLFLEDRLPIEGVIIGAGVNYNFPGRLSRTENNFDLGVSRYQSALGFHVDVKVRLDIFDKINFEPGLRFRSLEFFVDSFSEGPVNGLPDHLRRLNANGIELSLTFSGR